MELFLFTVAGCGALVLIALGVLAAKAPTMEDHI